MKRFVFISDWEKPLHIWFDARQVFIDKSNGNRFSLKSISSGWTAEGKPIDKIKLSPLEGDQHMIYEIDGDSFNKEFRSEYL